MYSFSETYANMKPTRGFGSSNRNFPVRLTDFEAIEELIMPIRKRCRDKGAASIQDIYISRFMVIGRRDAMASCTDRKLNLCILYGSI